MGVSLLPWLHLRKRCFLNVETGLLAIKDLQTLEYMNLLEYIYRLENELFKRNLELANSLYSVKCWNKRSKDLLEQYLFSQQERCG